LFSENLAGVFGLFDIAVIKQYTYIVVKYKINLHLLQNRLEKLAQGSLFYPLFLRIFTYIFCVSHQPSRYV
jgi:hypothetical protein